MRLSALVLALTLLATAAPGRVPAATADVGLLRATLPNGLRVLIVRDTLAPVVSTEVSYLVGSSDDPAAFPGLAHAQEHMLFRGTPNVSTDQLNTIATALGGDYNAFTRPTVTQFLFTVPANDLGIALHLEADRMRDVLDAQAQWQDERGAIEQEVAMDESAPGSDFFNDMRARVYAGTRYARDPVGTKASFDHLTGTELKRFYRTWYAPNNAILVVAGALDPNQTLAQITALFAGLPRRAVPARAPVHILPVRRMVVRRTTTLPYPLAAVGYVLPGVNSKDYVTSFLLQAVLNGERGPLRALTTQGLAIGSGFQAEPALPESQLGYAVAAVAPGQNPWVMTERLEAITARYAREGVPADLFEATKRRVIADQLLSRNSITDLATDWSDVLAVDKEPSIEHEIELLRGVTLADVDRLAKLYFQPAHAIVGALTPTYRAGAEQQHEKPSETLLPQRPAGNVMLPVWAQPALSDADVPQPSLRPTVSDLPNGIRLIVQPESISHSVFLFGGIDSEPPLQEPRGSDGISAVLEGIFDYGTATQTRDQFQRGLEEIAAREDAGSHFSLQVTSDAFDRGVQLLADNELHPRFDEESFRAAQRQAAGNAAASLSGSHVIALHKLDAKLLPANDPGLRVATPPSIEALALDQVRSYYAAAFRPDLTTIVVIGDVTPEHARRVIEHDFGAWKATGPKPDLTYPAVALNAPGEIKLTPQTMQQDAVTLAELIAIKRDDPSRYALTLGNAVLGGGAAGPLTSLLFRDLRMNTGLVYQVNTALSIGPTRSRFEITYASAPDNAAQARMLVDRDLRRMQQTPIAQAELALTKAALLRRTLVDASAEDAIAGGLLRRSIEGLPLDEPAVAAQRIKATTAEQIRDAFARWIRPGGFVQLTEGP
ncbi:insulinase family protein [bacterium]|nr:MAG: insulinase family protein [bacterium]